MKMSFKKAQMDTVKALENLYREGGHMEKAQVCKAVKALHNKVFALSYKDVNERSQSLLKKCKRRK